MNCDEIRLSVGALALGSLDERDEAVVRGHLDGCPECRREHDELQGLPRLMGLVSLADVEDEPPTPTAEGRQALLESVVAERRAARRRGHLRAIAGGLAVAAGAAGIGVVLAETASSDASNTPPQADLTLHAMNQSTGVEAEVELNDVGWGTKIALELSGVDAGRHCRLVATSPEGSEVAGSWQVPADVDDYLTIPGSVGAAMSDIEFFDVVADDGETLVHIPSHEVAASPEN